MTLNSLPNVLIVDDTPANISVMRSALSTLSVNIITANSGNEALSQLIRHEVALVLLDVQMPIMDGFEVAELMMLHPETRYIPILFVTAFDKDDKYIFRGYEVGAVDYIFKPFDVNVLRSKVSVFLKLYQQRQELTAQKNELASFLHEKEGLIKRIEEQSHKKDLLLQENNEQKKKLQNHFKFKLLSSIAVLTVFIALIGVYSAYISSKNAQLLSYNKEVEELNRYTIQLNEAYKKFIPYDVLALLNRNSILEVQLGDQVLKEMIVLFVDVRSYSTIAETLSPEENMTLINQLLQMMQGPVLEHHGIINKYLGDGLMAIFNGDADAALDASIAMLQNFASFSLERIGKELPPIRIGIGIDVGEMMVGTVGSQDRMEHTVIADAVNVASRIEGMTKMYGATLLISENIYRKLNDRTKYTMRLMDTVRVKGREKPVVVYQVFDGECKATIDLYKETMRDFAEGILLFRQKHFAEALLSFQRVLHIHPDDTAARIYVERSQQNIQHPVDNDWTHVRTLDNK